MACVTSGEAGIRLARQGGLSREPASTRSRTDPTAKTCEMPRRHQNGAWLADAGVQLRKGISLGHFS